MTLDWSEIPGGLHVTFERPEIEGPAVNGMRTFSAGPRTRLTIEGDCELVEEFSKPALETLQRLEREGRLPK